MLDHATGVTEVVMKGVYVRCEGKQVYKDAPHLKIIPLVSFLKQIKCVYSENIAK